MLRIADASLGDYYTEKEFKKLSEEQRAEYCAELARQDSIYKAELLGLQAELDQSRSRSHELRQEGDSLFALGTSLEKEGVHGAYDVVNPVGTGSPRTARHVVRRGESLWVICARSSVYGRGTRWHDLYRANRDRIKNPDLIYPGQELSIPR